MRRILLILAAAFMAVLTAHAQLKVHLSPDKNKVNRDAGNGVATVVFDSSVKGLVIDDDMGDENVALNSNIRFFLVAPETDEFVAELGYPRRTYILKSPNMPECLVETPEIRPNSVLYYNVVLPNQFPLSFTGEYLFTKSAKHGVRLSFGNQYGGYISYKWGEYFAAGKNIDDVSIDVDLTRSKRLGYIRQAITGGARFGLLRTDIRHFNCTLYLLVGGGYGEYGRQWENPTQVEGNIYFYSDYMKGFEGEIALQLIGGNWGAVSAGADMLVSNGKVSIDYMIGVGLNFNFKK